MHLKRQKATTKLPIPRKGTTYIARALSNVDNSVPIVIAIRDMLKLSRTASEVKEMIKQKKLKINNRIVKDYRESISLFNILEADKHYTLSLLPTGKFIFNHIQHPDSRLLKVKDKRLLKKGAIQISFHDGTCILSKDKISVGDSVYLDFSGKIKKHVPLEKGKEVFITKGKYIGKKGKIIEVKGKIVSISIQDKDKPAELNQIQVVAQ